MRQSNLDLPNRPATKRVQCSGSVSDRLSGISDQASRLKNRIWPASGMDPTDTNPRVDGDGSTGDQEGQKWCCPLLNKIFLLIALRMQLLSGFRINRSW